MDSNAFRARVGGRAAGAALWATISGLTFAQTMGSAVSPPGGAGGLGEAQESLVGAYASLDNLQEHWTSINATPYRALAIDSSGLMLYAVNVHDSRVRLFDFVSGSPAIFDFRTPWAPVSLGIYDAHPDGIERLLVVCRGTHALAVLDRFTGDTLDVLELPFEPADLLVDQASGRAFVSCSGARQVVQIELNTLAKTAYDIPALQPAYLAFGPGGSVLVAPLIAGNNSTTIQSALGEALIVDLDNPNISAQGLPDEDLFSIDPASGVVRAVSKRAGSALFAHGLNPATGNHWQLNLLGKNKFAAQTEPALNGDFVDNRLTITTLPLSSAPATSAHVIRNLDDTDWSTQEVEFDPARSMGQPTALSFHSAGFGFVCGALTDNVMVLSPNVNNEGEVLLEWDLPRGSIPRFSLVDPNTQTLLVVYCWGTNKVEVFSIAPFSSTAILTLDIGHDPAPAIVKAGRELFYDAGKSLHNNSSCAACHIEGGSDQLAWNLSGKPFDTKGPMHTQTLFGIDRLAPFHWRGERPVLEDFNVAFTGLLGGADELDPLEFEAFKAFVFSLRSPPNIGAHPSRVLSDALARPLPNGLVGSAVQGQRIFMEVPSDGGLTCMGCHGLPTGTNSDLISEIGTAIPSLSHMDVTAFNELEDKDMPIVPVTMFNTTVDRPLTGFGLLHNGTIHSRFDFVNLFQQLTPQERADVTEFMFQFDSGLGRAVNRAVRVDGAGNQGQGVVRAYLLPQAMKSNCDLIAYGDALLGGMVRPMSFAFRRSSRRFVAADSQFGELDVDALLASFAAPGAWGVFVGVAPGNGERFAIDADVDELLDLDEAGLGASALDPDSDDDGFLDGQEARYQSDPSDPGSTPNDTDDPVVTALKVEWVNTKNARITFRTSEPCTVELTYSTPGAAPQTVAVPRFAKVHNLIATQLLPSTFGPLVPPQFEVLHDYAGALTVTDAAGRSVMWSTPSFRSEPFIFGGGIPVAVVSDLEWTLIGATLGGSVSLQGAATLRSKLAGPPGVNLSNYVILGNVLVNGQIASFSGGGPAQSYKINIPDGANGFDVVPFTWLPGPFLISAPSAANGVANFSFGVSGLAPGDVVRFNVTGVYWADPATYSPADPIFGGALNPIPALNWSIGDTPKELRGLDFVY